jgi:hypothetical protein
VCAEKKKENKNIPNQAKLEGVCNGMYVSEEDNKTNERWEREE